MTQGVEGHGVPVFNNYFSAKGRMGAKAVSLQNTDYRP